MHGVLGTDIVLVVFIAFLCDVVVDKLFCADDEEVGDDLSCPIHESTDVHTSVEPVGVRTESEICQLRPEAVV